MTHVRIIALGSFLLIFFVVVVAGIRFSENKKASSLARDARETAAEESMTYPPYDEIRVVDLLERLRTEGDQIRVVDIRPATEYTTSHIPHSLNAPAETLFSSDTAPRYGKKIIAIVYDNMTEQDIRHAVSILKKTNTSVIVVSGGISSWYNNGGSTLSMGDPTSLVDIVKARPVAIDIFKPMADIIASGEEQEAQIFDVRNKTSYDESHLVGAISFPLENIERDYHKVSRIKNIFIYGDDSIQAFRANVQLYDLGFSNIYMIDGGYYELLRAEYKTIATKK